MRNIVCSLIFLFVFYLFAQKIDTWEKRYGDEMKERGKQIIRMNDGSFLINANKIVDDYGDTNLIWLIAVDQNGDSLWTKTIGDSSTNFYITDMALNDSGDLFVSHGSDWHGLGQAAYVSKKTEEYEEIWTKVYTNLPSLGVGINNVVASADSGCVISGGYAESFESYIGFIEKLDKAGNIIAYHEMWTYLNDSVMVYANTIEDMFVQQGMFDEECVVVGNLHTIERAYPYARTYILDSLGVFNEKMFDNLTYYFTGIEPVHYGYIISGESNLFKIDRSFKSLAWESVLSPTIHSIKETTDDNLFVGTTTKTYKLNKDGQIIWEKDFGSNSLALMDDGGCIAVGTKFDDVWICKFDQDGNYVNINDYVYPETVKLFQNYPNPFNPSTEISYSLKSEASVTLSVFNTKGELVRNLVNGKIPAGNHSINFKGDGLNSGIYFYRLSVDGKAVQSRKMMILK